MKQPTELFVRHPANPLLTADDWPMPVSAVFNPAACVVDGEVVLVCRVEDTTGISHLWAARSDDGLSSWRVDPEPLLSPRPGIEAEQWGFEDARIVRNDELDTWVLTCTSYGPPGPAVFLATTDLRTISPHGLVMPPEDKNAAVLPRRIGGDWVLLHRPATVRSGPKAEIWLSRSSDLDAWRAPERVMNTREGAWWDSVRIGIGPPPIETPAGWLLIYHGVRATVAGAIYRVRLALLDLEPPNRVIRRSLRVQGRHREARGVAASHRGAFGHPAAGTDRYGRGLEAARHVAAGGGRGAASHVLMRVDARTGYADEREIAPAATIAMIGVGRLGT